MTPGSLVAHVDMFKSSADKYPNAEDFIPLSLCNGLCPNLRVQVMMQTAVAKSVARCRYETKLWAWSVPWISKTHARQNETLRICRIHTRRVFDRNAGQFCGNSRGSRFLSRLCHACAVELGEYILRHGKAVVTQILYFKCLMELCCMPIQRFGLNTGIPHLFLHMLICKPTGVTWA